MGELADMIVEGILCECCGCYIADNNANGVPRYCEDCKEDSDD